MLSGCVARKLHFEESIALSDTVYQDVSVEFPKPKDAKELIAIGHGKEYQYWFSDSSVFYITTELTSNTLNFNQLEYMVRESEYNEVPYPSMSIMDTIVQSGHDKHELIWKEVGLFRGQLRYGYLNVRPENEVEFNQYLCNVESSLKGSPFSLRTNEKDDRYR
ncbi:hypothetical protein GCM10011318_11830 [Phaeocystidibacter marisrubri]|nr:hypothetical protein GCM10011318_11830 [Phaeocystidibacter marisrubri]